MSARTLSISRTLALPLDAVTQKLAFLGRTGSGKTYAATKAAECMLDAGAQVVALDPVGIWWGLRVGADGNPGYSIPVFGGLHGDVQLEPTAGALIADVVVDRATSAVIDVSQMIESEQRRFVTAFAERLFQRKKAAPSAIMVFLEECQEFIPQNPQQGEQHMLHAFQRLGKIGRNFGIGLGLISQRPQEISKKVLNQTECLFAFQMTGIQERKTIREWVGYQGGDEDLVKELPRYGVGECHVWSPQWLQISETVRIARKHTADVSSTPKVGAAPVETRALAPIDLDDLRVQMAETLERVKADDPKALQARVRELEAKLKERPAAVVDESAIASAVSAAARRERAVLAAIAPRVDAALREVRAAHEMIVERLSDLDGQGTTMDSRAAALAVEAVRGVSPLEPVQRALSAASSFTLQRVESTNGEIPPSQQRVLDAIAFYASIGNAAPAKRQVAGFVGVNPSTSTWRGYLAPLRAGGYLEDVAGDRLQLTAKGQGVAKVGDVPTRAQLLDEWCGRVSSASATILRALAGVYPATLEARQIAARIGVDVSSSTWRGYLAPLRKLGLVDDVARGELRASELLFPEGINR